MERERKVEAKEDKSTGKYISNVEIKKNSQVNPAAGCATCCLRPQLQNGLMRKGSMAGDQENTCSKKSLRIMAGHKQKSLILPQSS